MKTPPGGDQNGIRENWPLDRLLGALLILIDGIVVLANKTFYGWHYGSYTTVGWVEIILSLLIMGLAAYYKKNKSAVGWGHRHPSSYYDAIRWRLLDHRRVDCSDRRCIIATAKE